MKKRNLKPLLFLLPILIFSIAFVYYPFARVIVNSFSLVNAKGQLKGFAGLENYRYVFSRGDFAVALGNSLKLAAVNVPVTLFITIFLALLAEKKRRLSPVYETLFALPMSVSMSAACMIFKSMFSPALGWVNYFFGLSLGWFESRETALASCLILTIWMGIGFDFLLFLSALRGIPDQLLEASELDGAGLFTRIFRIKLPLISPTILYVLCTNFVLALLTSAPMIIITQGGPARSTTTLMYMMYASGFGSSDYSLAAVVALCAFVLSLGFTILSFVFERKRVHYQ
jgi:sn-glycerol 3-phosphate transport system permease protein